MASDDENEDYVVEAERKAKQNYLNEEVLDIGYSPELFMEYISKIKEPNIDIWTFEELQDVIKSFKMKHRPSDSASVPVKKVEVAVSEEKKVEPAPVPQENNVPAPSVEEIKHETNVLKSKPSEKNQLCDCSNLAVVVSEPQVTGGGIFSKKYVVYTITTSPFAWVVKRRYSQFLWLREVLSTAYLGSYLPPMPTKKAKGNLEDKTMFKRQQFLNQFIVVLVKDNLLRGSPHLFNFLKEPDEGKFKKYVKSTKVKKPETVEQTINFDGQALVEYSDCSKIYDSQMNYVNLTATIKKKIKQKCSQLMEDDRRLSEDLKKYADLIKELEEAQSKIPNNQGHALICDNLHESIMNWAIHEAENVLSVNQDIRIPFSYSYKEMGVIKDLLKERETIYSNYRKAEEKKKTDKTREALEKSKELYGYSNYKTQREVERVLKDDTSLALHHFSEAAKRQSTRVTKFHMIWGNLLSKLSEMKFDLDSVGK